MNKALKVIAVLVCPVLVGLMILASNKPVKADIKTNIAVRIVDPICVDDCLNNGYSYTYCRRLCSYYEDRRPFN